MRLETVRYQLEKGGPVYRGILVNEGAGPLLDLQGKAVEDVWDYTKENRWVLDIPEDYDA